MCARESIGAPLMFRLIRRSCGFGEDVADLRFEPGVKSRAAEAELVLLVLRMLISESCRKDDGLPMRGSTPDSRRCPNVLT